jgi:ABC-2 type transport system permease protein
MNMRYLGLLRRFLQLNLLRELAYRSNFYMQIFQSLLSLGFGLIGLAVIFDHTSALNEWHPEELLVLLGVYQLVGGVINLVIQPCMQQLMREVHQGTLDYTLLKPEDAQLLVSIRLVQIWKLCDIVLGLAVVGVALAHLGATVEAGEMLMFTFMLVAGGAIVYSFWLMLATSSFWLVRVENILVIFQDIYQAGRWPVSIYPSWLRWTLTFLVPVTVATTIPAQALLGQLAWPTLLGIALFALLALVLSRWFWLFGLRHYTGASA